MKIIFLDFDGVISVADTHYSLSGKKNGTRKTNMR